MSTAGEPPVPGYRVLVAATMWEARLYHQALRDNVPTVRTTPDRVADDVRRLRAVVSLRITPEATCRARTLRPLQQALDWVRVVHGVHPEYLEPL